MNRKALFWKAWSEVLGCVAFTISLTGGAVFGQSFVYLMAILVIGIIVCAIKMSLAERNG